MNDFTPSDGFFTCTVITLHEGSPRSAKSKSTLLIFPFFDYLNTPLYKSQLFHNKSKSFLPSGLVIKVKRNHHCFHHVFIARFHVSDVGSEGIVRKKRER